MSTSSSCLSGASLPTAVTCAPGESHAARTNGSRLAVHVITTSAPSTASCTEAATAYLHRSGNPPRLASSLAHARAWSAVRPHTRTSANPRTQASASS